MSTTATAIDREGDVCPECLDGYLAPHPELDKWVKCLVCGHVDRRFGVEEVEDGFDFGPIDRSQEADSVAHSFINACLVFGGAVLFCLTWVFLGIFIGFLLFCH